MQSLQPLVSLGKRLSVCLLYSMSNEIKFKETSMFHVENLSVSHKMYTKIYTILFGLSGLKVNFQEVKHPESANEVSADL